ncbi:glycosyltransferase [Desulfolutivibrio sulfoxidireducens]|uniref:glycosyltransferase n=1 Tax=Desulfolutivibrio sulfoxidireducens TaxID=2773299 RepID=UPI00159D3683|nr:glycosyltransferase [Desulfolutivibrio sulfoxidireducens]QLA15467.1 glycosyltransferase [Desulfolutivibrio sulfoxidireducens]
MSPSRPLRICLVDGPLGPHLTRLGHEVLELRPAQGVHDIAALLARHAFVPDILLHTEQLGRRVILRGVENLPCQTALWSVDTHVNAHWQVRYGELFDAVFTTQRDMAPLFSRNGAPAAFWLPWFGVKRPFAPFARRGLDVGFVGRLGPGRPVRGHFVELLRSRCAARIESELPAQRMLELYADTRLAPNEALWGEINFRLFETVSAGCLCLTPAARELGELFDVGREVEIYESGYDLVEKLRFYQARPRQAESLALAGHAALAARHLAGHRAEAFLSAMRDAPGRMADPGRARLAFHLALLGLVETGLFPHLAPEVEACLSRRADDPRAAGGLLRLWRLAGRSAPIVEMCKAVAARGQAGPGLAVDPRLAATASLAALLAGGLPLARVLLESFWPGSRAPGSRGRPLKTSRDICLFCAGRLREAGDVLRRGFVFDAARHIPQTAVEVLILAHALCPEDLAVIRSLEASLSPYRGVEQVRLGLLSTLSLHDRANWRLALKLALVNFRMFRVDQGGEELALARDLARQAGEEGRFSAMRRQLMPWLAPPGEKGRG